MNPNCEFCKKTSDPKDKLFEDDIVIAMLDEKPAAPGHIIVMPKEHYPIIENVPDDVVEHVFKIANKMSMVAFEVMKVQGTNIMVNNGIAAGQESAHFMVNVIPRKEGDGLDFQWPPKQLNEEEMSTVELQLKEQTERMVLEKEKPVASVSENVITEGVDEEENYILKQFLKKLP